MTSIGQKSAKAMNGKRPTEGGGAVLEAKSNIPIGYSIDLQSVDSSDASDISEPTIVIERSRVQVKRQTRKHDDEYMQYNSKIKSINLEEDEYLDALVRKKGGETNHFKTRSHKKTPDHNAVKNSNKSRHGQVESSTSRLASSSPQNSHPAKNDHLPSAVKTAKSKTSSQDRPDAVSVKSANRHKSLFRSTEERSTQARAEDELLGQPRRSKSADKTKGHGSSMAEAATYDKENLRVNSSSPDEVDDTTQGSHHFSQKLNSSPQASARVQSTESTTWSVGRHADAESTRRPSSRKTKSERKSKRTTTPLSNRSTTPLSNKRSTTPLSNKRSTTPLSNKRSTTPLSNDSKPRAIPSAMVSIHRGPPNGASVAIPDKYAQVNPTTNNSQRSELSSMSESRTTRISQEPTASRVVHQSGDMASNAPNERMSRHQPTVPVVIEAPPPTVPVQIDIIVEHAENNRGVAPVTRFSFPTSSRLIWMREQEMKSIARTANIPKSRWDGSLLFRQWKAINRPEPQQRNQPTNPLYVTITPPLHVVESWNQHFIQTLQSFYSSGIVHIPQSTNGKDVLMLLEYFGVVYSPDKLVFDSMGAYVKIKMWSDYMSRRAALAQYVIRKCMSRTKLLHVFVTTPDASEVEANTLYYVGGKLCDVFDGALPTQPGPDGQNSSCSIVFDFFNCDLEAGEEEMHDSGSESADGFAKQIRDNFSEFLTKSLPGTSVSFQRTEVKVKNRALMTSLGKRAVLTIDCRANNIQTTSNSKTTPVLKNHDVHFPEGTKAASDPFVKNEIQKNNCKKSKRRNSGYNDNASVISEGSVFSEYTEQTGTPSRNSRSAQSSVRSDYSEKSDTDYSERSEERSEEDRSEVITSEKEEKKNSSTETAEESTWKADPLGAIADLLGVPEQGRRSPPKKKYNSPLKTKKTEKNEDGEGIEVIRDSVGLTHVKKKDSTYKAVVSVNHPKTEKMTVEQLNAAWLGNMFGMNWKNWGSTDEKALDAARKAALREASEAHNLEALARQTSPFGYNYDGKTPLLEKG